MPMELRSLSDFNAYRVNFRGFGYSGTATAGQTTNLDFKLTESRLVYGGQLFLKNHVFQDKFHFQVVDVDNILGYGAGTVLGQYMQDWYVADDVVAQPPILVNYPTEVFAGLYIRVAYISTGAVNVSAAINILCVKNIT
jgi:hypothetical protein